MDQYIESQLDQNGETKDKKESQEKEPEVEGGMSPSLAMKETRL